MSNRNLVDFGGLPPFKYLQVPLLDDDATSQTILVFPRQHICTYNGFVKWSDASPIVRKVEQESRWLTREEAEQLDDWVQPIPCALIRKDNRYSVLKRVENRKRPDLCSRISLIVGGHVDQAADHRSFLTLLSATLKRELNEEIGIESFPGSRLGLVIDNSSIESSRHVGFVYEVVVSGDFSVRAHEEFSLGSKLTGSFLTTKELSHFGNMFDPWSSLIFENYLKTVNPKSSTQITLPGIT